LNAIKRSLIDGIGIGVGIVERVRGEWEVGDWGVGVEKWRFWEKTN
jgi:hypothetical protein